MACYSPLPSCLGRGKAHMMLVPTPETPRAQPSTIDSAMSPSSPLAATSWRVDLLVIRVRLLADPILVDDLDEDALEVNR